LTAPDKWWA